MAKKITRVIVTRTIKDNGEVNMNISWERSNPDEVIGILIRAKEQLLSEVMHPVNENENGNGNYIG